MNYCRQYQEDELYRAFRQLIIEKPVISYLEFRRLRSKDLFRPIQSFLSQVYLDLSDLACHDTYHFCPRCHYVQRQRPDGSYTCQHLMCAKLAIEEKLSPLPKITSEDAETYKVVTLGVHRYGTIPGLWEIYLAKELSKLGVRVTLWPKIDEFDL